MGKASSAPSGSAADIPSPAGPKTLVQWYLLSYNQVSFLGWFWILFLTVSQLVISGGNFASVFDVVWPWLSVVQTAAIFEVIHAALGWVRAPLLTTTLQVISRLFLVWGVNYMFPAIHTHWSFTTMVTAWSIAECVRYAYYTFHLASSVPAIISWARYTFFLVLYPAGVSSEIMMVYKALPYARQFHEAYFLALVIATFVYIPGFPLLFSHMLVQRKKYLRGNFKKAEKKAQ
ncbi:tyrosine phosphatase-like protein [Radiomyces spectabilis]|uniref:tyrosine phosphatase-like protein n=1 Tax=Radiomyces spectabilis TaxID=64574 RepID=UPI00221FCB92|nr:tyrosine phosphatase-like protein [Radiomyces spectabilis]KAI8372749.1 tyrosine phosphatase-like protein [Radiomyces spectabilis]